jgi:putative ABC transport system substrate-binding protein
LLIALVASALAAPLGSFPQQQTTVWRIGILAVRSRPSSSADAYSAFAQGMSDMGYVEGKDYVFEWVFADGKYERLPDLAAELVRRKVDVIVATASVAAQAAQRATRTIPIVAAVTPDPVVLGLAASLARPGGNVTGLSANAIDLSPKLLELLIAAVPKLSRVAVLVNPASQNHVLFSKAFQAAARKADVQMRPVDVRSAEDFEPAFASMSREGVQAVIVLTDAFFFIHRQRLADLAAKSRLPSIYYQREYVEAGGLMSYGESLAEFYRRSASFVDKILKGAKPGDLPFEQPTRFYLVINRKTAKALGLALPQELLLRADEVIE